MKILILDTSTEKSLAAITEGERLLISYPIPEGLKNSKHLISAIESLLIELKLKISDIKAIAVATGPGSFTGIRIGAAVAKGIAYVFSLPLISYCSLSGFIPKKEGKYISCIDAKMGKIHILHQERENGQIKEISTPKLVDKENICDEGVCAYAGPSNPWDLQHFTLCYPDAEHLAKLCSKKFDQQEYGRDVKLFYGCLPQAAVLKNLMH